MEGTHPTISIIIPTLNQGSFIEETLLSVLAQEYPATQLIVIDGGSTDGTLRILDRYRDRLHICVSEKDNGQSDAVNKGMKHASGELLTWLCSDDLLLPGALEAVAESWKKNPEAGLIHAGGIVFGAGRKEKTIGTGLEDLPLRYIAGVPFPQPSSFFTRKAFDRCGPLDTSLHYGMDYALFQCIALNFDVVPCDLKWSAYRLHPESKTSSQLVQFAKDWTRVFSRFINSISGNEEIKSILEEEGLHLRSEPAVVHSRTFTETEIRKIVCLFLTDQLRIRYELLDKTHSLRLLRLIRSIDRNHFRKEGLQRMQIQLKTIPVFLYRLIRRLKR